MKYVAIGLVTFILGLTNCKKPSTENVSNTSAVKVPGGVLSNSKILGFVHYKSDDKGSEVEYEHQLVYCNAEKIIHIDRKQDIQSKGCETYMLPLTQEDYSFVRLTAFVLTSREFANTQDGSKLVKSLFNEETMSILKNTQFVEDFRGVFLGGRASEHTDPTLDDWSDKSRDKLIRNVVNTVDLGMRILYEDKAKQSEAFKLVKIHVEKMIKDDVHFKSCGDIGGLDRWGYDKCQRERIDDWPTIYDRTGGCFHRGTSISTPQGSTPIEELTVGDQVVSYDLKLKNHVTSVVTKIHEYPSRPYLLVTLENGIQLKVTGEHPFYVPELEDWVKIEDLDQGDSLLMSDQKNFWSERIVAIEEMADEVTVYNITVDKYENYFAGGVLVHNKP